MDFIKSLRSSGPSVPRPAPTRLNSTNQVNFGRVPEDNPMVRPRVKESLKDRFQMGAKGLTGKNLSNSEKLRMQKEESRRNQRNNMINHRRIENADKDDSHDVNNESNLHSTFVLPEDLSPRKKKLALWRQQRREVAARNPVENRPVFKVTHVPDKIFERPRPMPKSYSFTGSTRNGSTNYRQNSTLLHQKPEKKEVHYFGNHVDSQSVKFTFLASVETFPDFLKGRRVSSPIKEHNSPIKDALRSCSKPDFEEMMKDLTPKDRAFLNETMEIRNKIINTSSTNLSLLKISEEKTSVNKKTKNPEETIVVSKSIEVITRKINETLNIDNVTPVSTRQCIEEETPENQAIGDDTFSEQTPKAIEKTVSEIMKTPAKTAFITERLNTPVVVINKEVIISPIPTPLETQISKDPNQNTRETIAYYRRLVTDKTGLLDDLINTWDAVCNQVLATPISEDNQGDIRCACGLAKLLIDERLAQFSELIDKCENTNSVKYNKELDGKVVLASDLQGFWDMIFHQVVDVEKRFFNLSRLKQNNWVEIIEVIPVKVKTDTNKFKAKINPLKKKSVDLADESEKPKAKPKVTAKSKFAEFKAKLAAQKATNLDGGDVEIVAEAKKVVVDNLLENEKDSNKIPAVTTKEEILKPSVVEEPKPTKSRKSIKPEITLDNLIDAPVENQEKKYNLRTRRSDLIKWDSPSSNNSPKRTVTKGIFTLPNFNSTIAEGTETENVKSAKTTPDIVFDFDDDYEPIVFSKPVAKKPTESTFIVNKENNPVKPTVPLFSRPATSPKTPQNLRQRNLICNSAEIVTKSPQMFKNISNSPLLKLAMISSHGKRQSLSTGKNMRTNFQISENVDNTYNL